MRQQVIIDHFFRLKKDANGNIDVNDFLYFIDSNKNRAPPIQPINPYVSAKLYGRFCNYFIQSINIPIIL